MRKRHWICLTAILTAIAACPVKGQDLSFLQPVFDLATETIEEAKHVTYSPRYINASSIRKALRVAGLPVPSMREMEEAFNRPDQQQTVIDSLYAVVVFGSPDDPRLRAINERRQHTILGLRHEWSGEIRWVRDDGIVLQVRQIAPLSDRDGYGIVLQPVITGPARYSAAPLLDGHMQIVIHAVRQNGEWITIGITP